MSLYCGDSHSFKPAILKYILNHPDHLQCPELLKRGMVRTEGESLALHKEWRYGPTPENRYGSKHSVTAYLDGIPSQCGMALLYSWETYGSTEVEFDEAILWMEDILRALKYSKVLVTLNSTQGITQSNLERNEYKVVDGFLNRRSGKNNVILTKEIKY